uniref:Uncharacterized protein n=1 Tax=Mustela putorius furo TaxID=9669 RepID=M3Z4S2_MUSPF
MPEEQVGSQNTLEGHKGSSWTAPISSQPEAPGRNRDPGPVPLAQYSWHQGPTLSRKQSFSRVFASKISTSKKRTAFLGFLVTLVGAIRGRPLRPRLGPGVRPWLASRATMLMFRSMLPYSAHRSRRPQLPAVSPHRGPPHAKRSGPGRRDQILPRCWKGARACPGTAAFCAAVTRVPRSHGPAKYKTAPDSAPQGAGPHTSWGQPPGAGTPESEALQWTQPPGGRETPRQAQRRLPPGPNTGWIQVWEEGERPAGSPSPGAQLQPTDFTWLGEIPAILRIREIDHPFPLLSCKRRCGLFSLCIYVPREVTDSGIIGAESLSLSMERVRKPGSFQLASGAWTDEPSAAASLTSLLSTHFSLGSPRPCSRPPLGQSSHCINPTQHPYLGPKPHKAQSTEPGHPTPHPPLLCSEPPESDWSIAEQWSRAGGERALRGI